MKNISSAFLLATLIFMPILGIGSGFMAKNFDQAGIMETANTSITVKEVFNHTGRLVAREKFECVCGTITGNGYIKGHRMKIVANDFQFKGIIECDGECTIVTSKPFDKSMCRFQGTGKFEFFVDEHAYSKEFDDTSEREKLYLPPSPITPIKAPFRTIDVSPPRFKLPDRPMFDPPYMHNYSKSQLIAFFWKHIDGKLLSLTPEQIDMTVEEVRFHIEKNKLDEKDILNELLHTAELCVDYNKKYIGQKRDGKAIAIGLLALGGGVVGTVYCYCYTGILSEEEWMTDHPKKTFGTVLCPLSILGIIGGALLLRQALTQNPRYKETHDQMLAVKHALEQALVNKRKNIFFH